MIAISESNSNIQIIIKDTGKGIDKLLISDIFKPGVTSKTRGWGLGLSLSKRIIEDYHKGSVYVLRSEHNEGTTMRVTLELKEKNANNLNPILDQSPL